MSWRLLLVIGALLLVPSSWAQDYHRLKNSVVVPLHYDLQLSVIDISNKKFTADGSILFSVLEDTNTLELFKAGLLTTWLTSRLVMEDGPTVNPEGTIDRLDSDYFALEFKDNLLAGLNYTIHFSGVSGSFGGSIVEVPSWIADDSSFNYLLTTGFTNTNFRGIFPSFDQPEFRTTFKFVINHPMGFNMATITDEVRTEGTPTNHIRQTFEIPTPLPTTSVAFAVTNMKSDSSTDNRVRVYHSNAQARQFLLNNYYDLLLAVEEELNMPMEFATINIVYVPTLPTKTLVKSGLIYVGPEMTPTENSIVHSAELRDIQKEVARSVYQLFFGQVINPDWWSDQWVTLGLARYFSGVTPHLPFDAEKEFISDTVQMTIREHNQYTSFAFMAEDYRHRDINSPVLVVVDQRAAALMRMITNIIGQEGFNNATLDFLELNRHSAITSQQFLDHLDLYSEDAKLPAETSLSQVIHKYVYSATPRTQSVKVSLQANKITVTIVSGERVDIPIDFTTSQNKSSTQSQYWLPEGTTNTAIVLGKLDFPDWVAVNPEQYGLYRVDYSNGLWAMFANELLSDPEPFNRAQLISDASTLASLRWTYLLNYLNLIRYLPTESDVFAWRAARISYEKMAILMRGYPGNSSLFHNYYSELTHQVYLLNRISSEMEDFDLSMEVGKISCYSGDPECVQDVQGYYDALRTANQRLVGSNDFQTFIYCTLAQHSDNVQQVADDVYELLTSDRELTPRVKNGIQGLACTTDAAVVTRFLEIATTDILHEDRLITLTRAERLFILQAFSRGSYESVTETLQYVLDHYRVIDSHIGPMDPFFHEIRYSLSTEDQIELLKHIESEHSQIIGMNLAVNIRMETSYALQFMKDAQNIHQQFRFWSGDIETAEPEEPEPDVGSHIVGINVFALLGMILFIRNVWY